MKRNIYDFYRFNTDILKLVETGLKLTEEVREKKEYETVIKSSEDVFLMLMIINNFILENKTVKIKINVEE